MEKDHLKELELKLEAFKLGMLCAADILEEQKYMSHPRALYAEDFANLIRQKINEQK